ncbi:Protein kinase STUNTED [Linum perenne]
MKMLAGSGAVVGGGGGEGRKVLVGVKMDSMSRELLTWALVKVAEPGDCVIALHVLDNNQIVDRDGKSSLLSLVKAFDSVLAVYEGFCNLKQVDLKLKICRGSSIRKILVREANSYTAKKLILGAVNSSNYAVVRSPTSVAKYCAKKLSDTCSVIAVHNGKVVFQRHPSPPLDSQGRDDRTSSKHGLLHKIHRSISLHKSSKIVSEDVGGGGGGGGQTLQEALMNARASNSLESVMKDRCLICKTETKSKPDDGLSCKEPPRNDGYDNTLALVPVPKVEVDSSSITVLVKQLPESKPGWPLLSRVASRDQKPGDRLTMRKISVVQWALRLPSRQLSLSITNGEECSKSCLDEESGAIVPVGLETSTSLNSPERSFKSLPKELEDLHEKYSATCRLFKLQELASATSSFLPENLIGRGGSSQVYKGCLPDGQELAVKILKPSEDVIKEFVLEIEIITALHHKNIISLLGFCFEDNKHLLLVYDLLSRGSLEENLHGNRKDAAFGWSERYRVALGVAEALDYLHNTSDRPVIHRDVKSSNILLSEDFEPQLSDFGLAKWASTSSTHIVCTDVAGTFGYLAPEYFMYGKVNDKIDVYAFGVVLLELISGRKPISNDLPKGQESVVMWARPILHGGKISQLLDQSLGSDYDHEEIHRMVLAATLSIRRDPRARPPMSTVLKLLKGDTEVTKWAKQEVNVIVEDSDSLDEGVSPRSDLKSHLNLALLDVEDDSLSTGSIEQNLSLEEYLQGRWSRSSSFD